MIRKTGGILAVALLALTLIVCGCGQPQTAPAVTKSPVWAPSLLPLQQETVVKVGMKQVVSDSGVLIGMAKGYYKDLASKSSQSSSTPARK